MQASIINRSKQAIGKIALPSSNGLIFCDCGDIVYCKSESNYTRIELSNGNSLLISRTLKNFEVLLQAFPFYRIHQSYLINLNYVEAYVKSAGGFVVLKGDVEISIARNRKRDFLNAVSSMLI